MGKPTGSKGKMNPNSAAESLKRQIDDLVAGRTRPKRPSSLRGFIEQKMAEDENKPAKGGRPK